MPGTVGGCESAEVCATPPTRYRRDTGELRIGCDEVGMRPIETDIPEVGHG